MSEFIAAWPLFQDAVISGVVAGALLGWLGVYVVLRRMVFLSAALGQTAGLGVALAFFLQLTIPPLFCSLALNGAAALGLLVDLRRLRLSRDALLGAMFLAGAAGTLAIGTRITTELHDIESLLFGSAVAVLPGDRDAVVVVAIALLALHLWWVRGFIQTSIDRDGAAVRGLPVRVLDVCLLLSLAIAIATCTRAIGALPVFAFSILPAVAAMRLCVNVPRAIALATLIGAVSGLLGYYMAFAFELPVGASQCLVALAFVLVAVPLGALLRRRAR